MRGIVIDKSIRDKIDKAMMCSFVGSYIFTDEELSVIYDDVGQIFRRAIISFGENISSLYYDEIFVALVNLAKEWDSEEDAFFDFIYRRLLGTSDGRGKAYNQIVLALQRLYDKNKIFMFHSFQKKYYTTLCAHAFAPISSMEAFFDMCWEIYCNDLNQQYIHNDQTFGIIADSLKNKFAENRNEDDNFQIGSNSYAIRAGIRGLALDERDKLVELLEIVIGTINALFNSSIIEYDNYCKILIKKWWLKKENSFGIEKLRRVSLRDTIIQDYSQIKPKYIFEDNLIKLRVPPIRVKDNFDYNPILEVKINDKIVEQAPLRLTGSGILIATRDYEFVVSDFNTLNICMEITHCGNPIYNSNNSLKRDFLMFNSNGKEIGSVECVPDSYFLYVPNFSSLLQYPNDLQKTERNIYSINALDGEVIQTKSRTIFFLNEKSNKEACFSANKLGDVVYKLNDDEFCVIDGELYVEIVDDSCAKNYGIKYEGATFKLTDFDKIVLNERIRYCISSLLMPGETQHIVLFKYADNSLVDGINLIKFNNIGIKFERELYYGKKEESFVEFTADNFYKKQVFGVGDDEIYISVKNGFIVVYPPLLKWKIDDGDWNTDFKEIPLWYKEITNSSVLHIEGPKDKMIDICANNDYIDRINNKLDFKIGEKIYKYKDTVNCYVFTIFAKVENFGNCHLFDIYTKEKFVSSPVEIRSLERQIIWSPKFFVGDRDVKFKLTLQNDVEDFGNIETDLESQIIDCSNFNEGIYTLGVHLVKKSFFTKEIELLTVKITLGDEKNFRFNNKTLVINRAMLFGKAEPDIILPVYIESLRYLGNIDCCDYYSGMLYVKNKDGKKIYLNNMKKDDGSFVRINKVRIEYKSNTSCYLGYGLDANDFETFEYDDEFTLRGNRITIGSTTNGFKNKSIDYFMYEVKNV